MNTRSVPRWRFSQTAALALLGCLVVLAATVPPGCVNVKVDADGLARKYSRVLDRITAEQIAKDKAREEGINVKEYTIGTQRREEVWWVFFDVTDIHVAPSGPAHFAVRVTEDGEAEVMVGQ